MSEQTLTATVLPEVEKKKKFYRNPKVIVGVVVGALATGFAVMTHGRGQNEPDSPTEESDVVTDIFPAETSV